MISEAMNMVTGAMNMIIMILPSELCTFVLLVSSLPLRPSVQTSIMYSLTFKIEKYLLVCADITQSEEEPKLTTMS